MSAEGRARRQSPGARGGAGAEAAAPEHPRGSEPRQPASPAPQRERPRRLARHLPPQCPRPSRGRAWIRLSKCEAPAPATHRVHSRARRGGRVAPAASAKAPGARPQRALGSLRFARGSAWPAGDSGGTGRGAGRQAARRRAQPGASVGPCGLPATLSKAATGQKVYTRARTGGARSRVRCCPESVQGLILLLSPLSFSVPFLFVHLVLDRGDIPSGVTLSPQRSPSWPAG